LDDFIVRFLLLLHGNRDQVIKKHRDSSAALGVAN